MGRPLFVFYPFAGRTWALWGASVLVCLFLAGCGSSSFLGRQYDNFTAYYNTFHNANQAFDEGVESFRDADPSIDRRRYLPVFRTPDGRNASPRFEDAVEKSADVLREHPNSKWVDDALLLIGKSYFYQENYVGAAQKFREAMAVESGRQAEARFWLARTLTTNGRLAEAAEALRLEEPDGAPENSWTARMYLVRGELLVRQQQWEEAERALAHGLSGDLPDEAAARAAFLHGQVRETLEAPAEARQAYRQVQEHDPPYELGFAARLSEIELQGEYGNAEQALERLWDLKDDDKNLEHWGEISLVQARVYRALGRPDDARVLLRDALYDQQDDRSLSGDARGRLHYGLATLYRDVYRDFTRAAAHLDTASTSLSGPSRETNDRERLPSAPGELEAQAAQYQNLAEQAREVARMDSLLRLGHMNEERFQTFVDSLRRRQAEERARDDNPQRAPRPVRGPSTSRAQDRERPAPAAETRSSDAGFLFHQDPTRVQEGRQRFEQTWGDRPRVDNWRRRVAMRRAEDSEGEREASVAAEGQPGEGDEPRPQSAGGQTAAQAPGEGILDLSAVPRDSTSQAEMEAERAVARYELANALFLVAGQPDSAATWYRRILQESGDQPIARRALYGLGEAYRAQGDTTAARQTFDRLVDEYPATPLARRAQQQLGRSSQTPVPDQNRSVPADSAYARAYDQWQAGAWRPALDGFLDVARTYPETRAAPRALLATGILYWQRLQADSLRAPRFPVVRYLSDLQARDSTALDSTDWGAVLASRDPFGADSTGTLFPPPDSLPQDSLTRPGDSVQTSRAGLGTGTAVGEALGLQGRRSADSSGTAGLIRVPDSVAYPPLTTLLTHLTDRYPEAPQVKRARSILTLIDERTAPADAAASDSTGRDSTAVPPVADSTARAAADSTADERRAPPDTVRRTERRTPPDTARATSDREPLPAPGGVRPSRENQAAGRAGWTLVVESFTSSTEASTRADALRRQLGEEWTVQALRDPEAEEAPHLIVIGRFGSERAARQVQSTLEEQLSRRLEVRPMPGGGR